MKKTTTGPQQKGLALKIVFILAAFAFLGIAFLVNLQAKRTIDMRSKANWTDSAHFDSQEAPIDTAAPVAIANPASTNCIAKGGNSRIETKPDGSQYGICFFDDNRQCEEWALMRGDCPVGGRKVTGYITSAAVFCAISGGDYTITKQSTAVDGEDEEGTCTFKDGQKCDADKFYDGSCGANKAE